MGNSTRNAAGSGSSVDPYIVGVSAGFWNIGKDPALLGLAQKAGGFGATTGVRFIQIDLERTSEFFEPRLKEEMKRMQEKMGIDVGLHGEIGQLMALESAERKFWDQAHERLCVAAKWCAEMKIKYINIHFSTKVQLFQEEDRLRPFGHQYQVVGPENQPLPKFVLSSSNKDLNRVVARNYVRNIDSDAAEKAAKKLKPMIDSRIMSELEERMPQIRRDAEAEVRESFPGVSEDAISKAVEKRVADIRSFIEREIRSSHRNDIHDILVNGGAETDEEARIVVEAWADSEDGKYFTVGGEIGAYMIVAYHMYYTHHQLWQQIVGSKDPLASYNDIQGEGHKNFNAAVAARYIEGHFNAKDHRGNRLLGDKSLKEYLDNGLDILFEVPESRQEEEGLLRLFDPIHAYHMIKRINSPRVALCIDFEHMLQNKLDPNEQIKKWPSDIGKFIRLFHLGEPKPYHPAHIPFALGSKSQEIIYDWLYQIRQKGFSQGILLFERGSGRGGGRGDSMQAVFENSVEVLRLMAKYLKDDIPLKEVPYEFYGAALGPDAKKNAYFSRQRATVRDHAFDPLTGLLMVPEETHTFLGKSATDKGKAREWDRAKYR